MVSNGGSWSSAIIESIACTSGCNGRITPSFVRDPDAPVSVNPK